MVGVPGEDFLLRFRFRFRTWLELVNMRLNIVNGEVWGELTINISTWTSRPSNCRWWSWGNNWGQQEGERLPRTPEIYQQSLSFLSTQSDKKAFRSSSRTVQSDKNFRILLIRNKKNSWGKFKRNCKIKLRDTPVFTSMKLLHKVFSESSSRNSN